MWYLGGGGIVDKTAFYRTGLKMYTDEKCSPSNIFTIMYDSNVWHRFEWTKVLTHRRGSGRCGSSIYIAYRRISTESLFYQSLAEYVGLGGWRDLRNLDKGLMATEKSSYPQTFRRNGFVSLSSCFFFLILVKVNLFPVN